MPTLLWKQQEVLNKRFSVDQYNIDYHQNRRTKLLIFNVTTAVTVKNSVDLSSKSTWSAARQTLLRCHTSKDMPSVLLRHFWDECGFNLLKKLLPSSDEIKPTTFISALGKPQQACATRGKAALEGCHAGNHVRWGGRWWLTKS